MGVLTMARNKSDEFVDPKVARLREVSGHNGPWTSAEYQAAIGMLHPTSEPDPEPPAELVEARERLDAARAVFDAAHSEWGDARLAIMRLRQSEGPVRVTRDGQLITDPHTPRKVRKAEQAADDLWKVRERAARDLSEVRVEAQKIEQAWRYRLRADAYEANRKK